MVGDGGSRSRGSTAGLSYPTPETAAKPSFFGARKFTWHGRMKVKEAQFSVTKFVCNVRAP